MKSNSLSSIIVGGGILAALGIVGAFGAFMFVGALLIGVVIRSFLFEWYNWILFQQPMHFWQFFVLSLLCVPIAIVATICRLGGLWRLILGLALLGALVLTGLNYVGVVAFPLFHIHH